MTAPESRSSRALHFALGLLVSLAASAVAVPLWIGGSLVMYFASLGNPFFLPGLILVPSVIAITYRQVKDNPARILGALLFYPLAALTAYVAYHQTIGRDLAEERKAMETTRAGRSHNHLERSTFWDCRCLRGRATTLAPTSCSTASQRRWQASRSTRRLIRGTRPLPTRRARPGSRGGIGSGAARNVLGRTQA